ncbi:MAG: LLM class flavin-dependent oxidoreductase [Actinomycetota bacterium]|nr:LLM class flavin-dependent oxidoreductase [Actinomycetota bacterium]
MEVGIGLPNATQGVTAKQLVDFGRAAEEAGFPSLGALDRVVYHSYESLVTFAAITSVTERIRLTTAVVLAPLRSTPILAKQAAAVQNLSGGRLVLGLGLGARDDDYHTSDIEMGPKGKRFSEQLDELKRLWSGEERGHAGGVGPKPEAEIPVIVGGGVEASFKRAARYGAGWIMGGGTPDQFSEARPQVLEAWEAEGREGEPRLMALAYYSLGANTQQGVENTRHYYDWLGEYGDQIAASVATDADTVKQYVSAFEEAGCDELLLFAGTGDPDQVSGLREALG